MASTDLYNNLPYKLKLNIPFENEKHIVYTLKSGVVTDELINIDNNLKTDTALGDINKFVLEYHIINNNILSLNFHSIDIRLLRLISNNIMESIKLSIECIDEFAP